MAKQQGLGLIGNAVMTVSVIQPFEGNQALTAEGVKLEFFHPTLTNMVVDLKFDAAVLTFPNNAIATSFVNEAAAQEYIDFCNAHPDYLTPKIVSSTIVPYIESPDWVPIERNPYFPRQLAKPIDILPSNWPLFT